MDETQKFIWTDKCDDQLFKSGSVIMTVCGRSSACQKFVEALSYKIDAKCDFRQTCGRYFILVPKDKVNEAIKVITTDWLNQFVVKYSDESYNNETYFEPVTIY